MNSYPIVLNLPYTSVNDSGDAVLHQDAFAAIHLQAESEVVATGAVHPVTTLLNGWIRSAFILNMANTQECYKHAPLQINEPYLPLRAGYPANAPGTTREQREQTLTALHTCDIREMTYLSDDLADYYRDLRFVNFITEPANFALWLHRLLSFHLQFIKNVRMIAVDWVQDDFNKHRHNVTNQEPAFKLGAKA
jgi:uncharacterized protein YlbG (UPF0298 family)